MSRTRIGFTAFNRVCSIGHPVIYDTARVITKSSDQTRSDQKDPTPVLYGIEVCGQGEGETYQLGALTVSFFR